MTDLAVLIPTPLPQRIQEALAQRFRLLRVYDAENFDAALAGVAADVRAIATGVPILVEDMNRPITRAMMERLPHLEIIANYGVGFDNIDVEWAAAKGVVVTNTPDVLTEETADTAFGLLLNAVRQFPRAERFLREGRWLERPFELTSSLRGRTMGVLGLGRIGRAIARRAKACGVEVIYHNRSPVADAPFRYCASLLEMARDCDILMIAAPGGPQTRGLVGREALEALGPDGVLINIARGSIVDEDALVAALRDGVIRTAGLDVYADEPRVPQALIEMEHVVLLPHVGSASHATRDAMGQLVVDNLTAWADGRRPLTPIAETPVPQPHSSRQEEL